MPKGSYGYDVAGNCRWCGEAGRCTCDHGRRVEESARWLAAAPGMLRALRMFVALNPECHRGVQHCGECAVCLGNAAISAAPDR